MIRRSILEWQRIAYGNSEHEIPEWAADRLASIARSSSIGGEEGAHVLIQGRHDLRAGGVVGVVVGQGCLLEILPKIDGPGDGSRNPNSSHVRQRLVHMLAVALDVDVASGLITELDWQRDDMLEILIGLFARKLADAVRMGLPRRYAENNGDLAALRGRLDVFRQFTALAATPQRLACRYDELSSDFALNQIMKAATRRLAGMSGSPDNQRMLRELTFAYADVADAPVAALGWDQVVLDRTNRRWGELLRLAKLLLGERFQTTTVGRAQGISLLFQMNTLFEEYVARVLAHGLAKDGLTVQRQGGRLYCLEEAGGERRPRFQTVPDLIVRRGSEVLLVIDTKWKRLVARTNDPKHGVSQADVYQMLAYNRVYRCPRMMLLYPLPAGLGDTNGIVARYHMAGSNDELAIMAIDVGATGDIAERLRALVMHQLGCTPSVAVRHLTV